MQINLSPELLDSIALAALIAQAKVIADGITDLRSQKKLKYFEMEDLCRHIVDLADLNKVIVYFGGKQVAAL